MEHSHKSWKTGKYNLFNITITVCSTVDSRCIVWSRFIPRVQNAQIRFVKPIYSQHKGFAQLRTLSPRNESLLPTEQMVRFWIRRQSDVWLRARLFHGASRLESAESRRHKDDNLEKHSPKFYPFRIDWNIQNCEQRRKYDRVRAREYWLDCLKTS